MCRYSALRPPLRPLVVHEGMEVGLELAVDAGQAVGHVGQQGGLRAAGHMGRYHKVELLLHQPRMDRFQAGTLE